VIRRSSNIWSVVFHLQIFHALIRMVCRLQFSMLLAVFAVFLTVYNVGFWIFLVEFVFGGFEQFSAAGAALLICLLFLMSAL